MSAKITSCCCALNYDYFILCSDLMEQALLTSGPKASEGEACPCSRLWRPQEEGQADRPRQHPQTALKRGVRIPLPRLFPSPQTWFTSAQATDSPGVHGQDQPQADYLRRLPRKSFFTHLTWLRWDRQNKVPWSRCSYSRAQRHRWQSSFRIPGIIFKGPCGN